jgi:hypothetical protein
MPFEIMPRTIERSSQPRVTLNSYGRIAINKGASALIFNNGFRDNGRLTQAVLLLWDREARRIGIQPSKRADERAYPLKLIGKDGSPIRGTGFSAITFLNSIHYNFEKSYSYPAKWENGMLVFTIPADRLAEKSARPGPGKGPF